MLKYYDGTNATFVNKSYVVTDIGSADFLAIRYFLWRDEEVCPNIWMQLKIGCALPISIL